jgi:hypothetical protein
MVDVPSEQLPDWLAALRHPSLGDLHLTPKIIAPEHIPDVLKAFGEQSPSARRRIVLALDEMAIELWVARKHMPPKKFAAADDDLRSLESAVRKLRGRWSKMNPYYQALLNAMFLMVPPKERRNRIFEFSDINLGPVLEKLLPVIEALRRPDIYFRAFSQPPRGRKGLERAHLWEPLFGLMQEFRIEKFSKHQPLIDTIRALHRVCKIKAPDPVAVRVAHSAWRKRQS